MNFGGQEMIVVLIVVLLLFGGKKIPELMRGVGKGMGELQKGLEESKRTFSEAMHHEEAKVHEITPKPADNTMPYQAPAARSDEAS